MTIFTLGLGINGIWELRRMRDEWATSNLAARLSFIVSIIAAIIGVIATIMHPAINFQIFAIAGSIMSFAHLGRQWNNHSPKVRILLGGIIAMTLLLGVLGIWLPFATLTLAFVVNHLFYSVLAFIGALLVLVVTMISTSGKGWGPNVATAIFLATIIGAIGWVAYGLWNLVF